MRHLGLRWRRRLAGGWKGFFALVAVKLSRFSESDKHELLREEGGKGSTQRNNHHNKQMSGRRESLI